LAHVPGVIDGLNNSAMSRLPSVELSSGMMVRRDEDQRVIALDLGDANLGI
jgi:hypothetical protein